MSLARHMRRLLARLLAVAIVTIVAGFGASVAQAHPGGHDGHRARAVAPVHAAAVAGPAVRQALPTLRAETAERECGGPCCVACTACCHSVLMPAAATAPPPVARPVRVALTQAAVPPGPAPEALPRPPRPFA